MLRSSTDTTHTGPAGQAPLRVRFDTPMAPEMAWAWGLFARDAGLEWTAVPKEGPGAAGGIDLLVSEDPGADLVLSPVLRRAWEAGGLQPGNAGIRTDAAALFPESGMLELPGGRKDVLGTAFYRINGLQEYASPKLEAQLDRYGRFPFAASLEHRLKLLEPGDVPFLPDALGRAFRALHAALFPGRVWPQSPPVLFVSHDVDRVYHGWKEDGKPALRDGRLDRFAQLAGKRALGLPEELDFKAMQLRNDALGLPGAWFVLPKQAEAGQEPPDADYSLEDPRVRRAFKELQDADPGALGLHAPAHAELSDAIQCFEAAFGHKPLANRHHFLRFRLPGHFGMLEAQGLRLDSSLAYAEMPGFRNGYARPFQPFDLEQRRPMQLLEVPFVWMDTTFKHYLQADAQVARASGEALLDHIKETSGLCGMLFHNDYLSGRTGEAYRPVLEAFAQRAKLLGYTALGFSGLLERFAS